VWVEGRGREFGKQRDVRTRVRPLKRIFNLCSVTPIAWILCVFLIWTLIVNLLCVRNWKKGEINGKIAKITRVRFLNQFLCFKFKLLCSFLPVLFRPLESFQLPVSKIKLGVCPLLCIWSYHVKLILNTGVRWWSSFVFSIHSYSSVSPLHFTAISRCTILWSVLSFLSLVDCKRRTF